MSGPKILLLGATGYIGGTFITEFQKSDKPEFRNLTITAPVRKQEEADILRAIGVEASVYKGYEDLDFLEKAAAEHDIVINAATLGSPAANAALIRGLVERKKKTGKEGFMTLVGGTSTFGDHPIAKSYLETRVFSDTDPDLYEYLVFREANTPHYPVRAAAIALADEGEAAGVKTYNLVSPVVYGRGTGLFNTVSMGSSILINAAYRDGFVSQIGPGNEEWSHIHVVDLAGLWEVFLARLLAGEDIPHGKKGLIFTEAGKHPRKEPSQRIAEGGKKLGYLKSAEVKELTPEEGDKMLFGGFAGPSLAELGFASRSLTRGDRSRAWGWEPKMDRKSFEDHYEHEWDVVIENIKKHGAKEALAGKAGEVAMKAS